MSSEPPPQSDAGPPPRADFMAQMTFASMGDLGCADPSCSDSFCGRPSGVREAKEARPGSFRRSRGNFLTQLFEAGGRGEVDDEDLGLGLLERGGEDEAPRSTISSLTWASSPSLTSREGSTVSSEDCRRRVALSVVCLAAFSLFILLITVLMDEGRTVTGGNVPTDKISVGTWNVLCVEVRVTSETSPTSWWSEERREGRGVHDVARSRLLLGPGYAQGFVASLLAPK